MSRIGIMYSSFNNYDLLEEVLNTINYEGFPVINIDDHSIEEEIELGKKLCKKHNIEFIHNSGKGVQLAVDDAITIMSKKYGVDWVFCFQQDIFPLTENFFSRFQSLVDEYDLPNVGAIGFNVLDDDKDGYCLNALSDYHQGKKVNGLMGIFFLSDSKYDIFRIPFFKWAKEYARSLIKGVKRRFFLGYRWFSPRTFNNYNSVVKKYNGVFCIDLPMWAGVAINVKHWQKHIKPDSNYIFHMWFNDIAMQFLSSNIEIAVTSNLYLLNRQSLKEKYGFHRSSAQAGKDGNAKHVEKYGRHLEVFKEKWGFDYEEVRSSYPQVRNRYINTLVDQFYMHNCRKGPIKLYQKKMKSKVL